MQEKKFEKRWYTVKVQNARERSVSERLKIEMGRTSNDVEILIPTEPIFFVKDGKKAYKDKILYPGYIFVETAHVGELEQFIKQTNGATNVLKDKDGNPLVMKQSEVDRMIGDQKDPIIESESFFIGEDVIVLAGPFEKFNGKVESIDRDRVKVLIPIFGRDTLVDLKLNEVRKK